MKNTRYQIHHEIRGERIFLVIGDTAEVRWDANGRPNLADVSRVAERAPSAEREIFATDNAATIKSKIAEIEAEVGQPLGVSEMLKEAMAL